MKRFAIKDPTTRKVVNRGWVPVRYRYATQASAGKAPTFDEALIGWVVDYMPRRHALRVYLPSLGGCRVADRSEMRYITMLKPDQDGPIADRVRSML